MRERARNSWRLRLRARAAAPRGVPRTTRRGDAPRAAARRGCRGALLSARGEVGAAPLQHRCGPVREQGELDSGHVGVARVIAALSRALREAARALEQASDAMPSRSGAHNSATAPPTPTPTPCASASAAASKRGPRSAWHNPSAWHERSAVAKVALVAPNSSAGARRRAAPCHPRAARTERAQAVAACQRARDRPQCDAKRAPGVAVG
jgi:hypothetical protein